VNWLRVASSGFILCVKAGFVIFLVFAGPISRAQEFQAWNEVDLTASWRRIDFLTPFVARLDPAKPNPQMAATGLTADLPLRWGLTFTPGYLFADLPQGNYLVHLPLLALTETTHLSRLTLADRNRFEKLIGYPGSPVRYRNRLLLDCPFGFHGLAHAFIDDELFFNLSAVNFNQNRFQTGAGLRLHPRFLIDMYYLRKNPGSGSATYVLGTTLRVSLTRHISPTLPTHNP
jgi:Protein of unknown function (DUF2490)